MEIGFGVHVVGTTRSYRKFHMKFNQSVLKLICIVVSPGIVVEYESSRNFVLIQHSRIYGVLGCQSSKNENNKKIDFIFGRRQRHSPNTFLFVFILETMVVMKLDVLLLYYRLMT